MDVERVTVRDAVQTAAQIVSEGQRLAKPEVVANTLPRDTTFALVVEGRQRNLDESFVEADVSLIGVGVSNVDGRKGQFVGYLCLTPSTCRIYTGGEIVAEAPLAQVVIDYALGILTIGTQRFQLAHAYPIKGESIWFESQATGLYNGLGRTYELLEQAGATGNKPAAKRGASVFMVFWVVGIILLLLIIFRKH